jgi:hypothetical protein
VVLLSNVDRYFWAVVRAAHPELDRFGALLLSCDLGLAKPEPRPAHLDVVNSLDTPILVREQGRPRPAGGNVRGPMSHSGRRRPSQGTSATSGREAASSPTI